MVRAGLWIEWSWGPRFDRSKFVVVVFVVVVVVFAVLTLIPDRGINSFEIETKILGNETELIDFCSAIFLHCFSL